MNKTIECLELNGFKYNPNIHSKANAVSYDKDDDTYIEIVENYRQDDVLTILYYYQCEMIRVISFLTQGDSCFWKEGLEHFIERYLPDEMK